VTPFRLWKREGENPSRNKIKLLSWVTENVEEGINTTFPLGCMMGLEYTDTSKIQTEQIFLFFLASKCYNAKQRKL